MGADRAALRSVTRDVFHEGPFSLPVAHCRETLTPVAARVVDVGRALCPRLCRDRPERNCIALSRQRDQSARLPKQSCRLSEWNRQTVPEFVNSALDASSRRVDADGLSVIVSTRCLQFGHLGSFGRQNSGKRRAVAARTAGGIPLLSTATMQLVSSGTLMDNQSPNR